MGLIAPRVKSPSTAVCAGIEVVSIRLSAVKSAGGTSVVWSPVMPVFSLASAVVTAGPVTKAFGVKLAPRTVPMASSVLMASRTLDLPDTPTATVAFCEAGFRTRALGDLQWPKRFAELKAEQQAGARMALQQVDAALRQAVLDEWAARCGKHGIRNPAGYLFGIIQRAMRGEFDAVIAPYHDVGMTAIKVASFGSAVNVTLGLPFPRTSPDHGTALDIAGQDRADPSSMIAAMQVACSMVVRTARA